jgi:hypothetical protein
MARVANRSRNLFDNADEIRTMIDLVQIDGRIGEAPSPI